MFAMRKLSIHTGNSDEAGLIYEPVNRGERRKKGSGYSVDLQKNAEQQSPEDMRTNARAQLDRLMRLENESPDAIFGKENLAEAFVSEEKLRSGKVKLCVGCVDEGVEGIDGGPKIGVAGTGVLMTVLLAPERARRMSAEEFYAYLSNPQSGDGDFWKLVANLRALMLQGHSLDTSSHERCGAVMKFIMVLKKSTGIELDPDCTEKAIAKRLHTALGLSGLPRRIGIERGDSRLKRHPDRHDKAVARTIDDSGRFRPKALGIGTLMTTGATAPSLSYVHQEIVFEGHVIAGPEGILEKDDVSPILLVSHDIRAAMKKYAPILEGETVLTLRAPQ